MMNKPSNIFKNLLLWLGIVKRKTLKYDFSSAELKRAMIEGSVFAINRYGLDSETIKNVEYSGNILNLKLLDEIGLRNVVPRGAWVGSKNNIGYGYGGNRNNYINIDVLYENI